MANNGFNLDISGLLEGIENLKSRSEVAMEMKVDSLCQVMQTDAQINARWTDRTGKARKGLNCTYAKVQNGYQMTLAHGVDYGIWLELANEKRYSIIPETIEYTGTFKVIPDFQNFLEKLGS